MHVLNIIVKSFNLNVNYKQRITYKKAVPEYQELLKKFIFKPVLSSVVNIT
jgi:hypothetical protein